jgi:hypothetical protein
MDKKSCQNCFHRKDTCTFDSSGGIGCKSWKRNQDMWISILPEEPGWYWHERWDEVNIMKVTWKDIENWKTDNNDSWAKLFKWQGPMRGPRWDNQ